MVTRCHLPLCSRRRPQRARRLHVLLNKWRHTAYLEMREPGAYYRMPAKAEQIQRTGNRDGAASAEDMRALIQRRREKQEP